jgi:heme exporter protein A
MAAQVAADSERPRLDVRDLHLWRGERHLLRGVSLSLQAGELLQVVGPNGVGKTSLLRSVAGLLPVESGEIEWRGRSIAVERERLHRELAYLAHVNALKSDLTALENLHYGVGLRRTVRTEALHDALVRTEIRGCADLAVRMLSAGQKRRLAIARILLSGAALWVLDEPITNLDKAGIAMFEQCMAAHLAAGGMVLTAAHQLLLENHSQARTVELH